MNPVDFPESNAQFRPPPDLTEEQCRTVPAYVGTVRGGSVDGSQIVVTAWQPLAEDLELLKQGKPIYLSFIGGLPPHFVSMDFQSATHPA